MIQYRHPLESLISGYKWEVSNGVKAEKNFGIRPIINQKLPIWNLYTKRDTYERWAVFLEERLLFWQKFVHKWIINNSHSESIYVPYHQLIDDSNETIKKVARFIHLSKSIKEKRISDLVIKNDIYPRNSIQNFKYYDKEKFRMIEDSLSKELATLRIPRVF